MSNFKDLTHKIMEQRFKSLSLFEFQERFSSAEDYLLYLSDLKWSDGFRCKKCGHEHSCSGKSLHSRQCRSYRYRYVELPRAQTLFHQVKFDLLKAFYIVYFVSTNKKGITTSTELSCKLNLQQKTYWSFKRKVMKAMKSSGTHPIIGKVEVDETVFGGQETGVIGRQNHNKKLVVVAVEKKKKEISRMYARVIEKADAKNLGAFMENLTQIYSGEKGKIFPELHRAIMNLKAWLRGIHHHINDLQDYLDEYCYRFNRSFMKENIFDNLLNRMIDIEPCLIKNNSN